jgi:hypothetical protein
VPFSHLPLHHRCHLFGLTAPVIYHFRPHQNRCPRVSCWSLPNIKLRNCSHLGSSCIRTLCRLICTLPRCRHWHPCMQWTNLGGESNVLNVICIFLGCSPASEVEIPMFQNRWNWRRVPKRWHLNYRCREITHKKAYDRYCYVYSCECKHYHCYLFTYSLAHSMESGFGGLEVSMLASRTQDRGFKPGGSCRIFSGVKILKQFVPCRRFAARKRTLLDYVEVESLRPNYADVSRSKFPLSLTKGLRRSNRFAGAPRSAPTLVQHGRPLEMEGGNQKVMRCTMGLYKAWVLTG